MPRGPLVGIAEDFRRMRLMRRRLLGVAVRLPPLVRRIAVTRPVLTLASN
jgi:hypothetical protein